MATEPRSPCPIGPNTDDLCVLIQASKQHRKESAAVKDDELIGSAVQLTTAIALLVRPDHERMLRLAVALQDKESVGPWTLRDGQLGVFYELLESKAAIGLPGYFHKPGKGVIKLRLEVDMAIAGDLDVGTEPSIETTPVRLETELRVRARKAMTGLVADLVRIAALFDVPPTHFEPEQVKPGEAAIADRRRHR